MNSTIFTCNSLHAFGSLIAPIEGGGGGGGGGARVFS